MKADFHMHTCFSSDADTEPSRIVKKAIELGLETICFTDHFDKDYSNENDMFQLDTEVYFQEMRTLRELYKDQIDIRIGVELGLQPHLGEFYDKYVKGYPFDFVIGSVHVIGGQDPYYPEFFEGKEDADAYRQTFEETLINIRRNSEFDVLGHLDYIVRYGRKKEQEYSYHKFADIIDEILRYLIIHGKGIELNTAGFKYGLGFGHPHPDILRRYKELGGEIITVGSDGHKPEHIAYNFRQVAEILRQSGFRYYTEFHNRKPIFKELV